MDTPGEVTELLHAWHEGDESALQELTPLVYDDLRRVASGQMAGERKGVTLQPTALVHEAYFRLSRQNRATWRDRAHFLAVAALVMRRLLVERARRRAALKRGGDAVAVTWSEVDRVVTGPEIDLIELDDALERLAELSARQARVVELRFFGGLTIAETAEELGISPATVKLDWTMARAWLFRRLSGG
ncbi:MAG: sigma-70 family RNA polymerase sigma factor [Acidobacteriota bacterium]|jgi:RNA polymerase sigma factor (TIGR02999 family)